MDAQSWNLFDTISIVGYPLVAWLAYKGGKWDGMVNTIEALAAEGLIDLEEDEEEA